MLPVAAFAQEEADIGLPTPVLEEDAGPSTADEQPPRLADGAPGRGTVEDPPAYWAANGWPDNISFAYIGGSEQLADGTVVFWVEIGMVNANDTSRQAILDLVSPNCRVTFYDCSYPYKQREAAFNEIYASRSDIVTGVVLVLNAETVLVEIAEGYEKEYAQKYIEQYGSFVAVTNQLLHHTDAMTGAGDTGNNAQELWLWTAAILLIGAAAVLYMRRRRMVPAMQTNTGSTVADGAAPSRAQTVAAVKNSAQTPPDHVFTSVMERIEKP
ncbi:MAG: hypothetical protein FWF10_09340 [Clostridiales bacterium]|nr:hypothetical protein [Clostridiales bacterium]